MAMDLANYLNETMLDNSYPHKNGIQWYTKNCMSEGEVKEMTQTYMRCYFEDYMNSEVKAQFNGDVEEFVSS
eukprot:CAMPEP_0168611284 /NCGR_PEP_ID=MMETSP0449_2-20121227/2276_1 /TAXON_ID=1082188 /ORGANISM="Strombidium rassoulzadegani, Strain ras09" /LENGTH=71 /DNA_ID=CAMNT_0008651721 /DNA_START=385 /DNA_END=600 /DNA_ORIENTATION=+